MTTDSHKLSIAAGGFTRPAPKWLKVDDIYHEAPILADDPNFKYLVDPDAILGFGEDIVIRGKGGSGPAPYFVDREYERIYLSLPGAPVSWAELVVGLVHKVGAAQYLADIEKEGWFALGWANVARLRSRVQLDFVGPDAVELKYRYMELIKEEASRILWLRSSLVFSDESKPSENKATLYLIQATARKEDLVNRAIKKACVAGGRDISKQSVLMIGDTLTDLYAGMNAGWDSDFVYINVGGSRLAECIEERTNFAGVNLQDFYSGLHPTARQGVYYFDNPLLRGGHSTEPKRRLFINGDMAYRGTIGCETLHEYLKEEDSFKDLALA